MEGARPRQGLGTGPVTGTLDRPSQGALENRKAAEQRKTGSNPVRSARRTVASIHSAELQLLAAAQRAARRQVIGVVDAALRGRHASAVALVVGRFADRRAALSSISDAGARIAAGRQLAAEEANELARLALEHAAEKRQLRKAATTPLVAAHRAARRALRQSLRRQRVVVAVQLRPLRPRRTGTRSKPQTRSWAQTRMSWRAPFKN